MNNTEKLSCQGFIFYDENCQVVKAKDFLRQDHLEYEYQPVELPWREISHKKCKTVRPEKKSDGDHYLNYVPVFEFGSSPRTLTETIQMIVLRPKTSPTKNEKEDTVEVPVIKGIKVAHGGGASFEVYIAKPIDGLVGTLDHGDFAGSFIHIKSGLELSITVRLKDIDTEDSEKLIVTLLRVTQSSATRNKVSVEQCPNVL